MPRGIPDPKDYGDLGKLQPGQLISLVQQLHEAKRAGKHTDLRLGSPETGLLSWATKKSLPGPHKRIAVFRQPLHDFSYRSFEGEIPLGEYGAGTVKKLGDEKVLVTGATPRSISFTTAEQKHPERFVLFEKSPNDGKTWLLANVTQTKPISYTKQHYKKVPQEQAEEVLSQLPPSSHVQPKIDGAALLGIFGANGVEVASYRTAKETGHPIIHTERVFGGRPKLKIPRSLWGSVVRGELYGVHKKTGKVIPSQELGGLLNSGIAKSLQDQQKRDVELKGMLFDTHSLGDKDITELPYEERLRVTKTLLTYLPTGKFHAPETVESAQAAELFRRIQSGDHPLTREGVVVHPAHGKPMKIKLVEDQDVVITGFFPGEGKYKNAVGGFTYALSDSPTKTVGRVGAGFSDELRFEMAKHPESYLGRTARVHSLGQYTSGAYRAPSLIALHEDIPATKTAELLVSAAVADAYARRAASSVGLL